MPKDTVAINTAHLKYIMKQEGTIYFTFTDDKCMKCDAEAFPDQELPTILKHGWIHITLAGKIIFE